MWLVLERDEERGAPPIALRLSEGELLVGRSPSCGLVVSDPEVSERHVMLVRRGAEVEFRDLDSSACTLVNGVARDAGALLPGDRLAVGRTVLRLQETPPRAALRPRGEAAAAEAPAAALPTALNFQPLRAFVEHLRRATEARELLERLLLGLVENFHLERGFVLLAERPGEALVPVASHKVATTDELLAISATACRRVLETGRTLAIRDTRTDSWYVSTCARSLVDSPRALVCAPLAAGGTALGVIYLDGPCGAALVEPSHQTLIEMVTGLASELLAAERTRERLLAADGRIGVLNRLAWENDALVVGEGQAGRELSELLETAAEQDVSVLLTGETGTGKELVARALHRRSSRRDGPFVPVNCAALPRELLEAELFGAERGTFTGATERRMGRFELAGAGTLFLDEVGDLPLDAQLKLLRVLQERSVQRLGGQETVPVNFRLVCATNVDLEAAVAEGSVRRDFYYRINVFRIRLRPLRERPEDLLPLARHFVATFAARFGRRIKGLTPEAEALLTSYSWPGNVRELRNAIERAVVVEKSYLVHPDALPLTPARPTAAPPPEATSPEAAGFLDTLSREYDLAREQFERLFLQRSLSANHGNVSAVAREAKMTRPAVYRRLARLGLEPPA